MGDRQRKTKLTQAQGRQWPLGNLGGNDGFILPVEGWSVQNPMYVQSWFQSSPGLETCPHVCLLVPVRFVHMGVRLVRMRVIWFTGVGVVRSAVLDAKGSSQWKNFSEEDYKFNVRAFRRWMRFDEKVCAQSPSLQALPQTDDTFKKRKVKAGDSSATPEPVRKRYKVIELISDDE